MKLYVTRGLPGSGKSTLAKQMQEGNRKLKRVNRDDLRAMIDDSRWSQKNEKLIIAARNRLIDLYLSEGFDVICDDTNLVESVVEDLTRIAQFHNAEVQIIDLRGVPYEVCVERDLKRQRSVGEHVIKRMWLDHICPPLREPVEGLPWAIIFDLDGTVADISHRNPYDASTCEQDGVRWHVVAAIQGMIQHLTEEYGELPYIFAFSGRQDLYRPQTERWLSGLFAVDALYMRKQGDTRRDAVIKKELFEQHVEGKFNVFAVVDDRPQVLRQWRMLGLTTIDVSEMMGMEF